MKLALSETLKFNFPVYQTCLPIMSLFNQFSNGYVNDFQKWTFTYTFTLTKAGVMTLDSITFGAKSKLIFVLRKNGSKMKNRMKEEEIEKGDCGLPTLKYFFWDFVGLEPSGT